MQLRSPQTSRALDPRLESRIRELFPLPLTPFEFFLLLDDRPELPLTFCVELVFRGRLDRESLQFALDESVARHPLLRAHATWHQRHPEWVLSDLDAVRVNWLGDENRHIADIVRPLDLQLETGLRVFAVDGNEQSTVWLHLHHVSCDGLGARRFVVDLLTAYAKACSIHSQAPNLDELDYESLRRRHAFESNSLTEAAVTTSIWQKLRDAFHFHVLTPQPLARVRNSVATSPRTAPIQKHFFNAHETAKLHQRARDARVSLNDVAMATLFVTLADWNCKVGSASDSQRLRVLMPTDLRSVRDDRMPAANRMSFSFISRRIRECEHWDALLTGIRRESQYIQQVRIGLDFLGGLSLAQQIPGLLPILMRLSRCMATAVLTNLGDPTKRFRRRFPADNNSAVIGNVALDRIFGTPPIRSQLHAGFGLCECSRQLCVSVLGNEQVLGNQTGELLQSYIHRWRVWGNLP